MAPPVDSLAPPGIQHAVVTSSSSITLSIQAFSSLDNLLSVSTILPSISDDLLALENNDIPSFPSVTNPGLYTHLFQPAVLKSDPTIGRKSACDLTQSTITIPTRPRLRVMLMESICVNQWAENVLILDPLDHVIWNERDHEEDISFCFPALPWIPEGSIFAPELLHAILDSRHPGRYRPSIRSSRSNSPLSPTAQCGDGGSECGLTNEAISGSRHLIHVLNSEGRVALENVTPIGLPTIMVSNSTAVLPISLESSQSIAHLPLAVRRGKKVPAALTVKASNDQGKEQDPYPGIPSPFLGSPSASSPTFDLATNPAASSMGLEAMCTDLHSRCPELRSSLSVESPDDLRCHWGTVHRNKYAEALSGDEDDWAFAQDLLEKFGGKPPYLPDSYSQSPYTGDTRAVAEVSATDSLTWGMSPTLTNPAEDSFSSSTPMNLRQQRRKTVIIETPVNYKDTQDAPVSGLEIARGVLEDCKPLPIESFSPSDSEFSCEHCRQSTPVPSRPSSTASMRPTKGILKEKKSVRFSLAPSKHECSSDEHDAHAHRVSDPVTLHHSTLSNKPRSPLQHSFSPFNGELRLVSPSKNASICGFPKHPALRNIARSSSSQLDSPQTPTPTVLSDQQCTPLRSLKVRQSLPAKRHSNVILTGETEHKSTAGDNRAKSRRLKTASTPLYVRNGGENFRVRRDSGGQKSRMPVPFRTILTKLRA
ncbi:uncharacterized protein FIBRA_00595 [Fibroporia radiculosa]|uniref:Uncharacterized protein n=1 Tax=Fibroporia radiculosa TaxID=599839 RepID=J4G0G8_9APHY|nr:uncharacterized protein FIBRA_00595 [Fibroporia radiculosa]CCL98593.1 predicted protein [Fibroporia radiculosa]